MIVKELENILKGLNEKEKTKTEIFFKNQDGSFLEISKAEIRIDEYNRKDIYLIISCD